jgi:NAD(P)-dependent dehydrogenase (short-subunit alcohol dehydrogenase family)/acyl carrier protein
MSTHGPWREIVYLWGLDELASTDPSSAELDSAHVQGCGGLLHVIQGIVGTHLRIRLRVVTRGAQQVGKPNEPLALAQASLWGLTRVVFREHPELRGALIDLDPIPAETDAAVLLAEFLADDNENQVALRRGARYGARLVHAQQDVPPPAEPLTCPQESTYLVTGGLGGLGLLTARWLVEHGARNMALVGRSAPTEDAAHVIANMEAVGVRVLVRHADVSDERQITDVVDEIDRTLPPLRGVIHTAGVLDDGVLLGQRWDRFARVLAPKVQGAWNLHRLTRHRALDFFVLFSSMTALFGTVGQGNYAAANAFLGALAHHRRASGLAAVTVDWGPWGQAGAAMRQDLNASLIRWGMREISPADGLAVLERAVLAEPAQLGVLRADWSVVLRQFPAGQVPPFLAEVATEGRPATRADSSAAGWAKFHRRVQHAQPSQQRELLQELVAAELADVLRLGPGQRLAPDQLFFEIGMDSLMAVELKMRLETALARALPATLVFEYPSIAALTAYLGDEVLGWAPAGPDPSQSRTDVEQKAAMAALDQLSERELTAVLDQEVARILEGRQQE